MESLLGGSVDDLEELSFQLGVEVGLNGIRERDDVYVLPSDEILRLSNEISYNKFILKRDIVSATIYSLLFQRGHEVDEINKEIGVFLYNWHSWENEIPDSGENLDNYFTGSLLNYSDSIARHFSKWESYKMMDWKQKKISRASFDYFPGDRPEKKLFASLRSIFPWDKS